MKKGANQDQKTASQITMDARKFLRTINESVGSKVAFFTKKVSEMGAKTGKNLRLVALDKRHLFYEDVDSNTYYRANISKDKNRYKVYDIKRVVIEESQKGESFSQFCQDLVESVDDGDSNRADNAFSKIESSRFRSTVVPSSGVVRTKDGNVHRIPVSESRISDDDKKQLISVLSEAIAKNYDITEDNQVVTAYFSEDDQIKLPATESMRRAVVARNMQRTAKNAWKTDGFQKFVKNIAAHVSKHKLQEAVDAAASFLKEYQEFCVLDQDSFDEVVENALFASNIFNGILAENVQELLYKTNLKVNKDAIIESWERTANKAQDSAWAQGVETLKESKNFSEDYDSFLSSVINEFKDTNTMKMALKFARDAVAKEGEMADTKTVDQLDDILARMERNETEDDAAYEEAQELLAGISYDLVDRNENLGDFDEIAAPEEEEELVAPEGAVEDLEGGAGGEGLDDLDIGAGDDMDMDMDMDLGGEDELGDDLGEEDDLGLEDDDELSLESKKKAVAELTKLYESYNKNFSKMLKEEGPAGMLAGVDQALAKAKHIGALAAEVEAKFLELQSELSGVGDVGDDLDTGMDAGPDDMGMGGDDYSMDAASDDEMEVDADYMGAEEPIDDETPMGDDEGIPGEQVDSETDELPDEFNSDDDSDSDDDDDDDDDDDSDDDGPPSPPTPPSNDSSEMDEDQYKWGTARHGQGERSGYGRSSINPVEESIVQNGKYAMAIAEDDGNFWLLNKELNEAVCVGDGVGQFDFEFTDDGSYTRAAKVWMEGIVASEKLVKQFWKRGETLMTEWEKPWEKKNEKEVDETHTSGMHDKSDSAEDMSGEVDEDAVGTGAAAMGVEEEELDESRECPQCGSSDLVLESKSGDMTCKGCGVVGQKELFKVKSGKSDMNKEPEECNEAVTDKGASQKGMVDPKSGDYESEKASKKWGDGSKRNTDPSVSKDDESGSKGAKEAPKSKKPDGGNVDGLMDQRPGKSDMTKKQ